MAFKKKGFRQADRPTTNRGRWFGTILLDVTRLKLWGNRQLLQTFPHNCYSLPLAHTARHHNMFRRPVFEICRDCAQGLRPSQRSFSTFVKRSNVLPKRPSAISRSRAQAAKGGVQQRRHAGTFMENAKSLYRDYPVSVTTASFIILFGVFSIGYINYYYQTYIIGAFHKFPEEVGQ